MREEIKRNGIISGEMTGTSERLEAGHAVCELHEGRTLVHVVHCSIPSTWNSAWVIEAFKKYVFQSR